jgi:hypothetical protein
MIQELRKSMNGDLDYLLEDGSLQDAMTKIAKLSEETTLPDAEEAWSVTYRKILRFIVYHGFSFE